jgi:NitT/TauT family transport system substrate-binding protein
MVVALTACTSSGSPSASADESEPGGPSSTPVTMTDVSILADWVLDASFAPHLYGIEAGIFEDYGINLELIPGQGSDFSMQQLEEGQVDFATADLLAYLAARADHDSPTTTVVTLLDETTAGLLVNEPAETLADLDGRTVAIAPFSVFHLVLPVVLEENGLDPASVQIELVDTGSFALLFEGDVDGMEAYKGGSLPVGTAQAEEFGVPVYYLDMADFGLVGYDKILVTTNDMIESDPDLVSRLVEALLASTEAALQASDDEIADVVLAAAPELNREEVLLQWEQVKELVNDLGAFDPEVITVNLGYVSDALDIQHDLQAEDVYTNEFIPGQ